MLNFKRPLSVLLFAVLNGTAVIVSAPGYATAQETVIRESSEMENSVAKLKSTLREGSGKGDNAVSRSMESRSADSNPSQFGTTGLLMLKGLGLCIGCFLIFTSIMRRLHKGSTASSGNRLEVLERLQVAPRTTLLLVRVDNHTQLVGVGAETVSFAPQSQEKTQDKIIERAIRAPTTEGMTLLCDKETRRSA